MPAHAGSRLLHASLLFLYLQSDMLASSKAALFGDWCLNTKLLERLKQNFMCSMNNMLIQMDQFGILKIMSHLRLFFLLHLYCKQCRQVLQREKSFFQLFYMGGTFKEKVYKKYIWIFDFITLYNGKKKVLKTEKQLAIKW